MEAIRDYLRQKDSGYFDPWNVVAWNDVAADGSKFGSVVKKMKEHFRFYKMRGISWVSD
jgi:hypothetical protein